MASWDEDELTRVLAGAVLLAVLVVLGIGLTTTATSQSYTELYVLNETGAASDYPTNLSVNETGTVLVGLSNHEGSSVTYTVVLKVDNERVESRTFSVAAGETWRKQFSVTPRTPGTHRLDIILYKGGTEAEDSNADQRLHLWINATETATQARDEYLDEPPSST